MIDNSDLFTLKGKTALITGSSQGIGLALAKGMYNFGAKIILNGRNKKKLDEVSKTFEKQDHVFKLNFDVTSYKETEISINNFEQKEGQIDILVNNAGIQFRSPLENFPEEEFNKLIQTNIISIFNVSKCVAKFMIKREKGKIINIASVQTSLARPGIAPYTASKGAVGNFTKGMATDWAKYGLQCNAIAPGYFKTPLNEALVQDKNFSEWLANRTPAGRWGDVKELIGACIFLSSNASSFVNGHILYVDGGITASL